MVCVAHVAFRDTFELEVANYLELRDRLDIYILSSGWCASNLVGYTSRIPGRYWGNNDGFNAAQIKKKVFVTLVL